jgi:hypothetical protein
VDLSIEDATEFRARTTYRRRLLERERQADAIFVARAAQRVLFAPDGLAHLAHGYVGHQPACADQPDEAETVFLPTTCSWSKLPEDTPRCATCLELI